MNQRRFRMVAMKRKQRSRIGPRCKEFWPSCIVCLCYAHFDKHGRFPTFDEVNEAPAPITREDGK